MNKITIYRNGSDILINYNGNDFLFSFSVLNDILNEDGLPCKLSIINISGYFVTKICTVLRNNGMQAKSFNAFSNSNVSSKYIIKVKEKNLEKIR